MAMIKLGKKYTFRKASDLLLLKLQCRLTIFHLLQFRKVGEPEKIKMNVRLLVFTGEQF